MITTTPFVEKFEQELKRRSVEILPILYIDAHEKIARWHPTYQATTHEEKYVIDLVDDLLQKSPDKIQFCELVLPAKAIKETKLLISGNVLLRYIKMTEVRTDEEVERWDALIKL